MKNYGKDLRTESFPLQVLEERIKSRLEKILR